MIKAIPGAKSQKFWEKKAVVEGVAVGPPLLGGAIGAYKFVADGSYWLGGVAAVGALWLAIALLLKVRNAAAQDADSQAKKDHEGLRGAMHVLHATTGQICGIDPSKVHDQLRVTFHRVVDPANDPQELEQIVGYVGGKGGGEWRRFSIRAGVTGQCIRTKSPSAMHRPPSQDAMVYRRELARDWGFLEKDLQNVDLERQSFLSVPVMKPDTGHVLGVIYFDAKLNDMFTDEEVLGHIVQACGGVARYVNERYGK